VKPSDPALFSLFNEIAIVEQLARHRLERVLPDGLLQPHFAVLNHLVRVRDGTSPLRIARAMQVVKGAMTNTLQRLESRGLIRIEPDPEDGRGKRVFITDQGREMRTRSVEVIAPFLAEVSAVLSDQDIAVLLPLMQRLRQHLDQARSGDL
jgi:DNA-binding MarR family transcriptional regulator